MRLWLCVFLGLFLFDSAVISNFQPSYAAARRYKKAKKKPVKKVKKKTPEQIKAEEQQKKDFRKAEADLYAKKTDAALPELVRLCNTEYLRACSMLGFAYVSGRYGVKEDFDEGVKWYQKCADKENNFFCHNELGRLYYRRNEFDKAFDFYQKGAKAGNSVAEYRLGRLYLEGKGVPANAERALRWLRRAAHDVKKPSKDAQCALVEMSYYGIGMRPSAKDTSYWLKKCDNKFIKALRLFYGHGVKKNRTAAKEILEQAQLNEALNDWNDFIGNSKPSVGKTSVRDIAIPEDCSPKELLFGTGRKNPKIQTYAVKIFHPDYYRSFDVRDGVSSQGTDGRDQVFEACGITFYTTLENKRLLNRALHQKAVIKISVYKNACLGAEMTGVCDLNLPWQEKWEDEE